MLAAVTTALRRCSMAVSPIHTGGGGSKGRVLPQRLNWTSKATRAARRSWAAASEATLSADSPARCAMAKMREAYESRPGASIEQARAALHLALDRLGDRGLGMASGRGAWALLLGLVALLARGLGRRFAPAGPAARLLRGTSRFAAVGAAVVGAAALLALAPLSWLPWIAASGLAAAAAFGWSLRPLLADLVAGLSLRVTPAARPGAPDRAGRQSRPEPCRTVRPDPGT